MPTLAADYDGTLAVDGRVEGTTLEALERLRTAGWRLVLVTGRRLPHVLDDFPGVRVFDRVVAENGALLYRPAHDEERCLGPPPPAALLEELDRRGVAPLGRGRVIVATSEPQLSTVAGAIGALGLDHQLILNKGAVMILPAGVDKATGLAAALAELGCSAADTVAVGDAENDEGFLASCGTSVAVANALPALKEAVDRVTPSAAGAGVVELVDALTGRRRPAQAHDRRGRSSRR